MSSCSPVRALRSKRGVFAFGCLAVTVGLLACALNSNHRRDFLAPGPLAKQHAQILADPQAARSCSACHAAGDQSTGEWIVQTVAMRKAMPSQTSLCMDCHQTTFDPQSATLAHGLPADYLHDLAIDRHGSPPRHAAAQDIACATCHREHHGTSYDLTQLADRQCQSCHQESFASLEDGHPEFGDWAYPRRTPIAFDHATHASRHFRKEDVDFQCGNCHQDTSTSGDRQGEIVSVTSYEACDRCHAKTMSVSLADGVPLLRLPTLDVDALLDAGFDIGQWPVHAAGEFDGTLPPLMRLLLMADNEGQQALQELGQEFDFYEAEGSDRQQMQSIARLVWAIKRLMQDLSEDAVSTLRTRFGATLGAAPDATMLRHLQPEFLQAELRRVREAWFLDLARDLRLEFGNVHPLAEVAEFPAIEPNYAVSNGGQGADPNAAGDRRGWSVHDERFLVAYFASGHDDPFLASLLSTIAKAGETLRRAQVSDPTSVTVRHAWHAVGAETAVGMCISCHSVDYPAGQVAWRAATANTVDPPGLTRFRHEPHLMQDRLRDCQSCHEMDMSANFRASYGPHARRYVPNFKPMTKASCTACHSAAAEKDACTTCHSYHGRAPISSANDRSSSARVVRRRLSDEPTVER